MGTVSGASEGEQPGEHVKANGRRTTVREKGSEGEQESGRSKSKRTCFGTKRFPVPVNISSAVAHVDHDETQKDYMAESGA